MQDSEMYYCLCSHGELWILGDHGDYEAANDTAESMGLEVVWLFGEETAKQWRNTLNKE
jgi:hypothetical protein